MPIDPELGKRIEKCIKDSPYSAKEVAEEIGVSPQAISKAIHKSSMGKPNLRKIAEFTGADEDELINGKKEVPEVFKAELMSRCIAAVKRAAKEEGMLGLDEAKLTHAALILYEANNTSS